MNVSCRFFREYFEDGFGSKLNLAKVSLFRFSSQLALPSGVETSKASVFELVQLDFAESKGFASSEVQLFSALYVNPSFSNSLMRSIPRSVKE